MKLAQLQKIYKMAFSKPSLLLIKAHPTAGWNIQLLTKKHLASQKRTYMLFTQYKLALLK